MKYILLSLLVFMASCEPRNFDRDKRQIIAKDQARRLVHGTRSFTVTDFREDTLLAWPDSMIIRPIRYSLDIAFNDSLDNVQNKRAEVIFTPEGNDILKTEILDRPLTGQ